MKGVVFYMSKVVKNIWLACGFLVIVALSEVVCYKAAVNKFEKMAQKSETNITDKIKIYTDEKIEKECEKALENNGSDSVAAGTNSSDTLSVQTIYQVEKYDAAKDISSAEYRNLPEKLVGLNRKQVDEYCHNYMNNMSADEFLAGLQSMGVIKKIYDATKIKYKYYLIAIDGDVVVYYGDKKTIFDYTGIKTSKLSKKEQNALKKGVEVKNEDELYGILENYSS